MRPALRWSRGEGARGRQRTVATLLIGGLAVALAGLAPPAAGHDRSGAAQGLERTVLDDGTELFTHGMDPVVRPLSRGLGILDAPKRDPVCASSALEPQLRIVYAALPGTTDPARDLRVIRRAVRRMDGIIRKAGRKYSKRRDKIDLRVACDSAGRIGVIQIGASKRLDFNGIVSLLRILNLIQLNSKFLIFYGDRGASGCGIGQVWPDDRLAANNAHNNLLPMYATVWRQCWDGIAPLHELSHMMGAVQLSAPHATGKWHCYDGFDVMCYDDLGLNPPGRGPCRAWQYDCGHDDFFDPRPRGYLAGHWNLASRLNRYLVFR